MSRADSYTCEEMFRRLDRYVERTLSEDELITVAAHLEECAACAAEYRFERSLFDEVRAKLQRIRMPSDLMRRISNRLESLENAPGPLMDHELD